MSDLILTLSAVMSVVGVSAIGLLVLPWSPAEARATAGAWSALGRAGLEGVSAGLEVVRGAAEPGRDVPRVAGLRSLAAVASHSGR